MGISLRSLWSDQIRANTPSPGAILQGQADALTQQTGGVLIGDLTRQKPDGKNRVLLALDIVVPALDDYRHRVLVALHDRDLVYPVLIDAEVFRPGSRRAVQAPLGAATAFDNDQEKPANRADSDQELVELVEKVLKSPQVVSLAQSLAARAGEVLARAERTANGNQPAPPSVDEEGKAVHPQTSAGEGGAVR